MSSYNVIKGLKDSVVVSGTVSTTVSNLNDLVNGNTITNVVTISGTQKVSFWVDVGSRFAVDSVRVWSNTTTVSGTTIEYDLITTITDPGEDDIVFVVASGLALHLDGYVYAEFDFPIDTPRYFRVTQEVPTGSGVINIQEVEVINDDDYVDFGSDGTQELLRLDHAPVGFQGEANVLPIYNDSDDLVDATVMVEKTGQAVDDMVLISATEGGSYTGRQDDVILPTEFAFSSGVGDLVQISSSEVESVVKSPKVLTTSTLILSPVQAWAGAIIGGSWGNSYTRGAVAYDHKQNDGSLRCWVYSMDQQSSTINQLLSCGFVNSAYNQSVTFGDRYEAGLTGSPWDTYTTPDRYVGTSQISSMVADPYSDKMYTTETYDKDMISVSQCRGINAMNKYNWAHYNSRYVSVGGIIKPLGNEPYTGSYWSYCRKIGVGRDYIYTTDGENLARCDKETLIPIEVKTLTSLGLGPQSSHGAYQGRHCLVSYISDDIIYVLRTVAYENPFITMELVKVDWVANTAIATRFRLNVGTSSSSSPHSIKGLTIDAEDKIWILHSDSTSNRGWVKVYDKDLVLLRDVEAKDVSGRPSDYWIENNVFSVTYLREIGLIYVQTSRDLIYDTSNTVYVLGSSDGVAYSPTLQSTYETPVIDLGASYNSTTIEWVSTDYEDTFYSFYEESLTGTGHLAQVRGFTTAPYTTDGVILDGTDTTYIQIGGAHKEDISFDTEDAFTIIARFKTTDTGHGVIFGNLLNMAPYRGYEASVTNDGAIQFYFIDVAGVSDCRRITNSTAFNDGSWYHLAITYDGSTNASGLKIYIDGSLEASTAPSDTLNVGDLVYNGRDIRMGHREPDAGHLNSGSSVKEVSFWNTVLTQPQISSYASTPPVGNEANLIDAWTLGAVLNQQTTTSSSIAKDVDNGKMIIEVRASNVAPLVKYEKNIGEYTTHPKYLPNFGQYMRAYASANHRPSICYNHDNELYYVSGWSHSSSYYPDAFFSWDAVTGVGTQLANISASSHVFDEINCLEYVNGSVYAWTRAYAAGTYVTAVRKYDADLDSWSDVFVKNFGGITQYYNPHSARSCVDPVNNIVYTTSHYSNTQHNPAYFYAWDPNTSGAYGTMGLTQKSTLPGNSVWDTENDFGARVAYISYEGIVRIMSFSHQQTGSNTYYFYLYDVNDNSWSTSNPWANDATLLTPDQPANDPAIWDGSSNRWATSASMLHVGDRVYMPKGNSCGSLWYHSGSTDRGQYTKRFAYYSLSENRWYSMPDLPIAAGNNYFSNGSNDRMFLYDSNTIMYCPFPASYFGYDYTSSCAQLVYFYNITEESWTSGSAPSASDPVWGSLAYEEVADNSLLFPQKRYVQAKFYFNNTTESTSQLSSVIIPRGITVQDIPPRGTKNVYVKTDIPIDESVATKIAKLKVWWVLSSSS